jgi:hypothetical protein
MTEETQRWLRDLPAGALSLGFLPCRAWLSRDMEKCNENSLSARIKGSVGRLTGVVWGDECRPGKPMRIPVKRAYGIFK